jgi:hypothetical protein
MFGGNRNQALFSQVAQALDSQLEVIGGLRNLVEAQEKRLAGSDALAAMHTDQIVALTTVIANIAIALTSSEALPRVPPRRFAMLRWARSNRPSARGYGSS